MPTGPKSALWTLGLLQLGNTYTFHFSAVLTNVCFKGRDHSAVGFGRTWAAVAAGSGLGLVRALWSVTSGCRLRELGSREAAECGSGQPSGSLRFVLRVTAPVLCPFLQSYLVVSDKARDAAAILVSK